MVKALNEIDPKWMNYPGYILVGSHSPNTDKLGEVLAKIKHFREQKFPILGLCMGMQFMCIEYMRNVWGVKIANTTELDGKTTVPVIHKLPNLRVGIAMVGDRLESHWHNYAFNPDYTQLFEKDWDMVFTDNILEEMKLKKHPFCVGVQYHPEYENIKGKPHPILKAFIHHAKLASQVVADAR